jgi:selenium metabolism protein YedF
MKTIDCRGQSCPAPVIATKKALDESTEGVCVLVDDGAPRENVARFAHNRGYHVSEKSDGTTWILTVSGSEVAVTAQQLPADKKTTKNTVLLISSQHLGDGPEELGKLLMKNFLFTLLETAKQPDQIVFLNSGVLLAVEGAETVEALKKLEELGVELFACGVCLDYLKQKDQLAVGKVTNMFSTAENLLDASSVIKL